jgi:hypothetical protein
MFRHAHVFGVLALAGASLFGSGCASRSVVVAAPVKAQKPVALNQKLSVPLENGCRYDAVVRGRIDPILSASAQREVSPNLDVTAQVACPNETVIRSTRNVITPAPMTSAQLEQALETRASVATSATGQPCYYTPDFSFVRDQIVANGVAMVCTAPAQ